MKNYYSMDMISLKLPKMFLRRIDCIFLPRINIFCPFFYSNVCKNKSKSNQVNDKQSKNIPCGRARYDPTSGQKT